MGPSGLYLLPYISNICPADIKYALCSLTDEPDANDTITLFVTAFGLEGNTINVEPLLQYDKGVHNLTRANYGHQYQTRINVTGTLVHSTLQLCNPCKELHACNVLYMQGLV